MKGLHLKACSKPFAMTAGRDIVKKSGPADDAGRLLVCFDFEGSYGMPHKGAAYDLAGSASVILEERASQQARGVFFIVGRMIEEHPDVVQAIAAAGHENASDARHVFGVGGTRDRADARGVLWHGLADRRRHAALTILNLGDG